jgi:stage II sporulation protein E
MLVKEKKVKEKYKKSAAAYASNRTEYKNPVISGVILLICGVLFGRISSGSGILPVCTAFAAVLPASGGICVFSGYAVSVLASGNAGSYITELIAVMVIIFIKFFVHILGKPDVFSPRSSAIMSLSVYLISSAVSLLSAKITSVVIAAVILRAVLCGIISYFMAISYNDYILNGRFDITGSGKIASAVIYITMVASLSSVKIGSFCLGRAAGIFVILAAGGRFGCSGSAIVGVLTVLGVILAETGGTDLPDMIRSSVPINCSGLIAGAVSGKGRTASSVSFILSMLFLMLFMGKISWMTELMTDSVIAAVMYCIIPDRFYMNSVNAVADKYPVISNYCAESIRFIDAAIKNVRLNTSKAADLLEHMDNDTPDAAEAVCRKICSDCRNNDYCCNGISHRVNVVFAEAVRTMNRSGYITDSDLPKALDACGRKSEIAKALCRQRQSNRMKMNDREFYKNLRKGNDEQLSAAEDILDGISSELFDGRKYDENLSEIVKNKIIMSGGIGAQAAVYFDAQGHIFISVYIREMLDIPMDALTEKISNTCNRELDKPAVQNEDDAIRISWHEYTLFYAETGRAEMCGSEDVSGDNFTSFEDGSGNLYFIISDGMGSGRRAALESNMASSLLSKLIRSGTDIKASFKLVNQILISKSDDEIFTTVDMLKINLFSGKADFYKAGAECSFVKSGGMIKKVESESLPLGIMSGLQINHNSMRLTDGDTVVMFSDGTGEESFPYLRELMLSDGYSPQRCADSIIEYDKNNNPRMDDRTVITVKLHRM